MSDDANPATGDADESGATAVGTGAWVAIAGLFVLSTAAAAYEISPASVTTEIIADLGIGRAAAGAIISVMYAVAVAASVPVGAALDRTDLRRAVVVAALALLLAGLTGWLAAAAGNYPALLATRVLGGLAYVAIWNAGANLAARSAPPGLRATAVGVFTASAPAGFALGQLAGPVVAGGAGWPAIFVTFGSLAVLGLALFLWGSGRQRREDADEPGPVTPSRGEFLAVLRARGVWLICGMGFASYALYLFVNSWLPSYFTEEFGLSLAESGLLVAVFPAVGIVSRTAGGVLSDRVFGGRRRPVAFGAFLATGPLVVALGFVGNIVIALVLLVVSGAALQVGIGLLFSYVRDVVDEAVAATAISMLTAVSMLGALVAPVAAGSLIEVTGSYELAFLAAGAVAAAGVGLALLAPEPGG